MSGRKFLPGVRGGRLSCMHGMRYYREDVSEDCGSEKGGAEKEEEEEERTTAGRKPPIIG